MKGKLVAPDGWVMTWDYSPDYGEIHFAQPDGVEFEHVSGEIDADYLEKEKVQFLDEHSGQLSLF